MIQILFAVLAGILTVAAPCILPLLPILLGGSIGQTSRRRPFFIILGFIGSFTAFALTFSVFSRVLGLSQSSLHFVAVMLLGIFGLLMIFPSVFDRMAIHFSKYTNKANEVGNKAGKGNFGGLVLGAVMGILWAPCAGPVLGSILTLVGTQTQLGKASILLASFALGSGMPMLVIAYGGQYVTTKIKNIVPYTNIIQRIFGVFILLLAIAMYFKYDLVLQAKVLEYYPNLIPKY